MGGADIAGELISAIAQDIQVPLRDVLAFMNDAASAKLHAFKTVLSAVAPNSESNTCIGHTFSYAGNAIYAPVLNKAMEYYTAITKNSTNARFLFKEATDNKAMRKAPARWLS